MNKLTPMLWFDGQAEEAAAFYVSLFPDSHIDERLYAPTDNPSSAKGALLVVNFTLDGRQYSALNGGPHFTFSEAVSLVIDCADQDEVDHYWQALTAEGGSESMCGWCKDRFGFSRQVTPRKLLDMMQSDDRDAAGRVMQAMMQMRKLDIATLEAAYNPS